MQYIKETWDMVNNCCLDSNYSVMHAYVCGIKITISVILLITMYAVMHTIWSTHACTMDHSECIFPLTC